MRLLAAVVVVVAGTACGGDGPTPPTVITSLSLAPSTLPFTKIGETANITATPKDASGNTVSATVSWTSSDAAVATVVGSGNTTAVVTARGFGTATITGMAGGVQSATVNVRVGFNTNSDSACSNPDIRIRRIETETQHLIIASDVDNPPGGFTSDDYAAIAATFESLVWPTLTANFGMPADIDRNGKVIAFYTRAVNELTEAGSTSVVGGFFFGRDLFPKVASGRFPSCPGSNEAEMFYMLVPDPTGAVNGNVRSVETVRRLTVGVLGHEFQHLINSSRRLYVNQAATYPETTYMEEGLSHIAEELLFYEASGLAPRSNITIETLRATQPRLDAFNAYMSSNTGRLIKYLESPSANAPYDKDDDLPTRGAIWSFLRYLADRGTPGAPHSEPACTATPLAVGGECGIDGSATASFSVPAGAAAGEFAIVAFGKDVPGSPPGSIVTVASATNTITAIGPPNPSAASSSAAPLAFGVASTGSFASTLVLDDGFHAGLRRQERRELPARVAGARAVYAMRSPMRALMNSAGGTTPAMTHFPVEPVWSQLVNANDTGIVNLRRRFGEDISGAAQDWAVANYTDDAGLAGIPVQHTHPSWDFRSIMGALTSTNRRYPLLVHDLTASPRSVTMVDGGAAYYRFGLVPGTTATVSFTVNGVAPPASLKLVVVRTK